MGPWGLYECRVPPTCLLARAIVEDSQLGWQPPATSQVRNVTLDSIIRLDRGLFRDIRSIVDNALKRPTGVVEDDCRHTLNTHLVLWIHGAPKPTSTLKDSI